MFVQMAVCDGSGSDSVTAAINVYLASISVMTDALLILYAQMDISLTAYTLAVAASPLVGALVCKTV